MLKKLRKTLRYNPSRLEEYAAKANAYVKLFDDFVNTLNERNSVVGHKCKMRLVYPRPNAATLFLFWKCPECGKQFSVMKWSFYRGMVKR